MKKKSQSILFGPWPPPYGGVAVFMGKLGTQALENGIRVWAYMARPTDERIRHVNHRRLEHLIALIQEGRAARITDSTHFHLEYPHWLLLPLWLIAKRFLGFEWVKILHDGTLPTRYEEARGLRKWLFRQALKNVDEFVPVSQELAVWLSEELGVTQSVTVIPALLPFPKDWQNSPLAEHLKEPLLEFSRHTRRVCSVGIFGQIYGFQHVAEAIEQLRRESDMDIGLLLVDGGLGDEAGYREIVLQDRDWIQVIANVPNAAMGQIFRSSDVFVRGFAKEGYGLARIEALWSGVPVIAANSTETRGMLAYEFGDTSAICQHLRDVFDGRVALDAEKWSAKFAEDAEKYLQDHLRSLAGQ